MKDIILKAVKTFLQAFVATFMGYGMIDPNDKSLLKSLVIAGIAAGLSAVMNVDYKSLEGVKKKEDDEVEGEG